MHVTYVGYKLNVIGLEHLKTPPVCVQIYVWCAFNFNLPLTMSIKWDFLPVMKFL